MIQIYEVFVLIFHFALIINNIISNTCKGLNKLTGTVPSEIVNIQSLQEFNLGEIGYLKLCTKLFDASF